LNPKRIIAELPYPSLEGLTTDLESVRIISPAYSAQGPSEMTASLTYIYQHFIFKKLKMEEIADTLEGIGIAEMTHIDLLGTMITYMGAFPIYTANPMRYTNFYSTRFINYTTNKQKMIIDDIADEFAAINLYKSIIARLKNEQVAAVLTRIILDEKMHIEVLKEILKKIT